MRCAVLSSLLLALVAGFALADERAATADPWSLPKAWPPAESGKPVLPPRPPTLQPNAAENCMPGIPCGLRLLGNVQRNGAVELQVPAWRW
jgi:hypothetical protein